MAQWLKFSVSTTPAAQVCFLVVEPHHPSVSCHAVAAAHTEELERHITRIHNHVLGLWGEEKKKEEDWQQMLAQGQSSSPNKKNLFKNK